jgi:hypothetical protein
MLCLPLKAEVLDEFAFNAVYQFLWRFFRAFAFQHCANGHFEVIVIVTGQALFEVMFNEVIFLI